MEIWALYASRDASCLACGKLIEVNPLAPVSVLHLMLNNHGKTCIETDGWLGLSARKRRATSGVRGGSALAESAESPFPNFPPVSRPVETLRCRCHRLSPHVSRFSRHITSTTPPKNVDSRIVADQGLRRGSGAHEFISVSPCDCWESEAPPLSS